MELIKSINDVKGNVRLGQLNDIEIENLQLNKNYYFEKAHIKTSFFGLIKEEVDGQWYFGSLEAVGVKDNDKYIIIDNQLYYRPEVIFSFIGTDQKAQFTFDNNKQAAKFVREITKLLTLGQEWLKV